MYDRKAFKQEAKQLMRASTPHFMLVALVYVLLTTGLNYVVSWLTSGGNLLTGTLSIFLNILVWLFSIVMAVGFANYALRLSRREETGMGSLFHAFSFAGRSLGTSLLVALFMFLWSLLIVVAFAIAVGILAAVSAMLGSVALSITMGVLITALYIVVIVLIIVIALRYAMASFALVDDPNAGVMEAIRRSIRMMRGYKGKYFVLGLSFIGWELLVALIVCIVMVIGFAVSGAGLIVGNIVEMADSLNTGLDDLQIIDTMVGMFEELTGRLSLWSLLAEVLSLPLSLWLIVYQQTAFARFYNYVSGYDYHQYMNGRSPAPEAPLTPPAQEPRQHQDTPEQENAPERPAPPADGYYTSILPSESTGEEPETPEEPDDEEEI